MSIGWSNPPTPANEEDRSILKCYVYGSVSRRCTEGSRRCTEADEEDRSILKCMCMEVLCVWKYRGVGEA